MGMAYSTNGMNGWILVGNLDGKRLLGKPVCMWEYDIKMDLGKTGLDGMNWIGLA
jgi:hypothetical protein